MKQLRLGIVAALAVLAGCSTSPPSSSGPVPMGYETVREAEIAAGKILLARGYAGISGQTIALRDTTLANASPRVALQVELTKLEPKDGCTADDPYPLVMSVESPLPGRARASWMVDCADPKKNPFAESAAKTEGWAWAEPPDPRQEYLETPEIQALKASLTGGPGVRFSKGVDAGFRWRWRYADGTLSAWQAREVRIASDKEWHPLFEAAYEKTVFNKEKP